MKDDGAQQARWRRPACFAARPLSAAVGLREGYVSMTVFRCTQRVVQRFGLSPVDDGVTSSGVLGDWYANLFNVHRSRWVLCQSERSLLPIILPARKEVFPAKFAAALRTVLRELGVGGASIDREVAAARDVAFAKAKSRQVLGAMNDFAYNARVYFSFAQSEDPALEVCLKLAEMPSRPIGFESPDRFTLSLFRSAELN